MIEQICISTVGALFQKFRHSLFITRPINLLTFLHRGGFLVGYPIQRKNPSPKNPHPKNPDDRGFYKNPQIWKNPKIWKNPQSPGIKISDPQDKIPRFERIPRFEKIPRFKKIPYSRDKKSADLKKSPIPRDKNPQILKNSRSPGWASGILDPQKIPSQSHLWSSQIFKDTILKSLSYF